MALNIALPLSGIGEIFEGGLLSPISPLEMNFRDNFKMLAVSPNSESSSSGVSSLDSDEAKKFHLAPHLRSSSTPTSLLNIEPNTKLAKPSPRKPNEETDSSVSSHSESELSTNVSTDDEGNDDGDESTSDTTTDDSDTSSNAVSSPELATTSPMLLPQQQPQIQKPKPIQEPTLPLTITYEGRNVLDLASNLAGGNAAWPLKYTLLPENNFPMYLANRSQYHRLGPNIQEFTLGVCNCRMKNEMCAFPFPVDDHPTPDVPQTVGDQLRQFVQSLEPPQPPRFTNVAPQPEPRNQLFNSLNMNTSAVNCNSNMQYTNFVNQLMGNGVNNMGNGINNMGNGVNNMGNGVMGNNTFNGIMGNNFNNNYTNHNAALNRILGPNHNNNQQNVPNQKLYAHSMPTNKQFKPQNFMSMNMYKQF